MSHFLRPRALVSALVTSGLAVGGLSLATSVPASAATATQAATYSCALGATSIDVPATFSLLGLPDLLTAGAPVAGGTPFTFSLDSGPIRTLLNTAGVTVLGTNVAVNQLSAGIGATAVSAVTNSILTPLGQSLISTGGTLGTFTPGGDGLPIPTSFNLSGVLLGLPLGLLVPCQLKSEMSSTTTTIITNGNGATTTTAGAFISKQRSKIKARQLRGVSQLKVKVRNQVGKATGKVVVKLGGTKVGKGRLKNGKVFITLRNLRPGTNRVKVSYSGDAITSAGKTKAKVTLKRR